MGKNLICSIDEISEETGKSLSMECGVHTNDVSVSPRVGSKFGKSSEKSTNSESLVFHSPFASNIYRGKKYFFL